MKHLVYLLLLANLALFAWLYTHQNGYRAAAPTAAELPPSVERLVLLRERASAEPASVPGPILEPAESATDVPPASEAAAPPPQDDEPAEQPARQLTELEGTQPESALSVEEDAVQAETQPETLPEPAAPLPRVCQTIGPFSQRSQAEKFMSRLTALAQAPVMRTAQIEEPSGYWVYLPSMPRAEATRTIDDLAAKGVKDYFLGRQNVISLGIFSDKRTAEKRVRDIDRLGYQSRLEPRFVTREVYWVDFEESGPEYIHAEQWRTLLNAQPELRRQSLACE